MDIDQIEQWQIYRILVLKRGQDIGSLKIIAKNSSSAFRIAREVVQQSDRVKSEITSLRMLELGRLIYSGGNDRVLSREGV